MRRVWLLALRDLRLEVRDRSGLLSILAFLGAMLFIMALALGPEEAPLRRAAPGVLWVALAFLSTLLSTRAFALEVEEGTLEDLLLAPGGKEWIYLGKLLFQMLLLLPLGLLALFLAAGLFYLPLERGFPSSSPWPWAPWATPAWPPSTPAFSPGSGGGRPFCPSSSSPWWFPWSWPRCGPRRGLWKAFPWGRWPPGGSFSWCSDVVYVTASALLFPLVMDG